MSRASRRSSSEPASAPAQTTQQQLRGVAVLVDFRPTGKLRGNKPVDATATLGPVLDALVEDSVDLSRVRVVCDWVQYRNNFRDIVDVRPILAAHGHESEVLPVALSAVMTSDE